ncbi:MAG: hypothetical protein WD004_04875 [Actinomycetota bacterium]
MAAKTIFTDSDSYSYVTPEEMAAVEPSLTYDTASTASQGAVSIRDVQAGSILLVTQSLKGDVFCVADSATGAGTTYGSVDAQSAAECSDGW